MKRSGFKLFFVAAVLLLLAPCLIPPSSASSGNSPYEKQNYVQLPAGQVVTAYVSCNAGDYATGGDASLTSLVVGNHPMTLLYNSTAGTLVNGDPVNVGSGSAQGTEPTLWMAIFYNTGATPAYGIVDVVCQTPAAQNGPAAPSAITTTVTITSVVSGSPAGTSINGGANSLSSAELVGLGAAVIIAILLASLVAVLRRRPSPQS